MNFIKTSGTSIYLKASNNELFSRLSKNTRNRPLMQNKSNKNLQEFIKTKLIKREKFYEMADYTIETSNLSIEKRIFDLAGADK